MTFEVMMTPMTAYSMHTLLVNGWLGTRSEHTHRDNSTQRVCRGGLLSSVCVLCCQRLTSVADGAESDSGEVEGLQEAPVLHCRKECLTNTHDVSQSVRAQCVHRVCVWVRHSFTYRP